MAVLVDEGLTSTELSLSRRVLRPVALFAVVVVVVGATTALVAAAAFALVVRVGIVEAV